MSDRRELVAGSPDSRQSSDLVPEAGEQFLVGVIPGIEQGADMSVVGVADDQLAPAAWSLVHVRGALDRCHIDRNRVTEALAEVGRCHVWADDQLELGTGATW